MEEKKCTKCGKVFPNTNEYFNYRNKKTGRLQSECKSCTKLRRKTYKRKDSSQEVLYIRLSKKEKEVIKENAKKVEMNITKYITLTLLKNRPIIVTGIDEINKLEIATNELAHQTKKIGNNVNQVSHNLNAMNIVNPKDIKEFTNSFKDLKEENERLIKIILELMEKMNGIN